MAKQTYHLQLKGYVGGWNFDADYTDYVLSKNDGKEVHVLIDSLGGSLATALSMVASFKNHGNVHVHYVGMNASAATIVSLGAAHVSIDSSAMYLVHKCSMEFFQWASANADKLRDIIKEAEQMKADLDKMDANIAQMYAAKCKREPKDLLALMKKGGWLTAQEAMEWGFVDEITDYEDDAAPVIDDRIAADMGAAGIPIPVGVAKEQSNNMLTRLVEALTNFFRTNNTKAMNTQTNIEPEVPQQEVPAAEHPAKLPNVDAALAEAEEAHAAALAAKNEEIARLQAEIEELKRKPGDSTSQVVEAKETPSAPNPYDTYCQTVNRAQAIYNSLPH